MTCMHFGLVLNRESLLCLILIMMILNCKNVTGKSTLKRTINSDTRFKSLKYIDLHLTR